MPVAHRHRRVKLQWRPAINAKRPDNIISSEFPTTHYLQGFQHLAKEKDDMFLLLSMEYGRRWLKVRDDLDVEMSIVRTSDSDFLFRRYVIRGLLLKKKSKEKEELFKMKKFQKVPPKIRFLRDEKEIENAKQSLAADELQETMEGIRNEEISFKKSLSQIKANS